MIQEDRSQIFAHSSRWGLLFGLYWAAKYVAVLLAFDFPFLMFVYVLATIAVPFIGYVYTKRYRDAVAPEGGFSFMHAWQYGSLLYLFASIIVSLPHYFFYQRVLPAKLPDYLLDMKEQVGSLLTNDNWQLIEQAASQVLTVSPMMQVMNDITTNVFWGMLFSFLIAFILKRPSTTEQI